MCSLRFDFMVRGSAELDYQDVGKRYCVLRPCEDPYVNGSRCYEDV